MVTAFIVLMVMLGTLVAAGPPILRCLWWAWWWVCSVRFPSVVEMSSTACTLGPDAWSGVGIDYSLFILNRYRMNLLDGMPKVQAIVPGERHER